MKKHLDQYYPKYPGKIWEFPNDKKFDDFDLNVDVLEAGAEYEIEIDDPELKPRLVRLGETPRINSDGTIYVDTPDGAEPVRLPENEASNPDAVNPRSAPPDPKEFEVVRTNLKGGSVVSIVGIRASDVQECPIQWLWKGRLPVGSGLVISGPAGCNKSMAVLDFIARVTKGLDWPDGAENTLGPREVLIAATEDDQKTTIKPRLMAAGADCSKVIFYKTVFEMDGKGAKHSRPLNLEDDTARLYEMLIAHPEILLVVLDPLTGFYGDVDGNDNKKIRPMMQRIANVCRKTNAAFIMIIHENKKSEAAAIDRILMGGCWKTSDISRGVRLTI
jgi:hypothetical protein